MQSLIALLVTIHGGTMKQSARMCFPVAVVLLVTGTLAMAQKTVVT
jgi:hypothetical protein